MTPLEQLAAAYPKTHLGQATLAVYAADLADIDPDVLAGALVDLRRTSRFFPTIAEIREACAIAVIDPPNPAEAFRQASTKAPMHELVAEARTLVGDSWHWQTSTTHDLERQFRAAYAETRDRALRKLQVGA